jgi:putative ABC transport system ATP-binding protein
VNEKESPIIETVDLCKDYDGGHVRALRGLDLRVETGEFVALSGPSGCGKSTLLHLVAALDRPTSGTILIRGRDLSKRHDRNRYRRLEVGIVFQLHNLIPRLTARENIEMAMFGMHHGSRGRSERASELLSSLDLTDVGGRTPPRLSGGERQRVAIARALANHPAILLADEPTGNLDPQSVEGVLSVFEDARQREGTTVIVVTHDATVAARADRVVHLRDGRVADAAVAPPVARTRDGRSASTPNQREDFGPCHRSPLIS